MKKLAILVILVLLTFYGCIYEPETETSGQYGIMEGDYNPLEKYKDYPMTKILSSMYWYPIAFLNSNEILLFNGSSFTNLKIDGNDSFSNDGSSISYQKDLHEVLAVPSAVHQGKVFFVESNTNTPNIYKIKYYDISNRSIHEYKTINIRSFLNYDNLDYNACLAISPNGRFLAMQIDLVTNGNSSFLMIVILDVVSNRVLKEITSSNLLIYKGMSFSEDSSKIVFCNPFSVNPCGTKVYDLNDFDRPLSVYDGEFYKVWWNGEFMVGVENYWSASFSNRYDARGVIIINTQNGSKAVVGNLSRETHGSFFDGLILYTPIIHEEYAILSPDRKKLVLKVGFYTRSYFSHMYDPDLTLAGGIKAHEAVGIWVIDISRLGL